LIINVRGTNGSGKTTIVRTILGDHANVEILFYPLSFEKRWSKKREEKPLGYICTGHDGRKLFVVGHYEQRMTVNGGIDTIPLQLQDIYDLIETHHSIGQNILYEGKNFSESIGQLMEWHQNGIDARAVFINHPVEACIASVRQRGHNIDEQTIYQLHDKSEHEAAQLAAAGIRSAAASRAEALDLIREWLGAPYANS